ncbi:hypothetical protein QJS10_CPA01g02165 [Acorus calamus]|uniref:Uncharacterized protein n=1 Tax=Acorus calamus TaxID=4465 RepID=A0AAV9FI27_ACOCL|nr:hypothetical protein QJS10_CPA01g02165 [Acorus calamus]
MITTLEDYSIDCSAAAPLRLRCGSSLRPPPTLLPAATIDYFGHCPPSPTTTCFGHPPATPTPAHPIQKFVILKAVNMCEA